MPVPYYPQTTITPNLGLSLVGMDEVLARDMVLIDAAVGSGGGAVTSVFGRVGVVVAQLGDYTVAQVTGAAPLASPPLTGVPTTPTAAPGTNTTQLASTAFVAAAVAAVVSPVASVFGRTGAVVSAVNDYDITQISGLASGIATFLGTPTSANLAAAVTNETGTGALLFANNPTMSGNGAASVSALLLNGTMFTSGGTGTTTIPYALLQPSTATAVTTWATTGTVIGINAQPSFVGNFIDFRVNGGSLGVGIQLSTTGKFTVPGSTNSGYFFSARGGYTMAGDGIATLFNAANTGFDRIQLGGQTTSFPALKRNLAAVNVRLADDSADASITAATATPGTNTTQLATTAFVTVAVAAGGVVSSVFGRVGAVVAAANDYDISQINSLGTGIATWLTTPTSANLIAAMTDETGTGALVFANNATFTGVTNFANGSVTTPTVVVRGTGFGMCSPTTTSLALSVASNNNTIDLLANGGSIVGRFTLTALTPSTCTLRSGQTDGTLVLGGSMTAGNINQSSIIFSNSLNMSATSVLQYHTESRGNHAPTSGTGSFVGLMVDPIINQTSTASGTVRVLAAYPVNTSLLGTEYLLALGTSTITGPTGTLTDKLTVNQLGNLITQGSIQVSGTTATWTSGTGTPEGAVTAPIGSLFTRTDGGANTTLYVKESGAGNTGWIAK